MLGVPGVEVKAEGAAPVADSITVLVKVVVEGQVTVRKGLEFGGEKVTMAHSSAVPLTLKCYSQQR